MVGVGVGEGGGRREENPARSSPLSTQLLSSRTLPVKSLIKSWKLS